MVVGIYMTSFSSTTVHSSHHKSKPSIRNISLIYGYCHSCLKSKSRGHSAEGASNTPQRIFFSFFLVGQLQCHSCSTRLLHAEQLTEEDFPLSLYVAVWRCSYNSSQSRGWGSAIGIVCRTSSSNCRALCRWISIQQGVSLMLWRG